METLERIKQRRSIRKFKPEQIPHEIVEQIVEAAAYAPSWKNTQATRYLIVEDKALIEKISAQGMMDFSFNQKTLESAAALVVVCSIANRSGYERDGSYSTSKKDKWEMFDAGIASQTFMLAASELGIGTVLMGIFDEKEIHRILALEETYHVSALIAMGYPDEQPQPPKRKSAVELVQYR